MRLQRPYKFVNYHFDEEFSKKVLFGAPKTKTPGDNQKRVGAISLGFFWPTKLSKLHDRFSSNLVGTIIPFSSGLADSTEFEENWSRISTSRAQMYKT